MKIKDCQIILFILSQSNLALMLVCNDYCSNRSSSTSQNCFCTDCHQFFDCCQDNKQQKFDSKKDKYECIKLDRFRSILALAKCNKSIIGHIKSNCEKEPIDLWHRTPVFSKQTEHFYKNIYCALCNIQEFEINKIIFFNIITDKEIQDSNSSFLIIPPYNITEPRSCFKSIDTCPLNTKKELKILCSNYTAYRFTLEGKVYKNEYCAECNEEMELLFCENNFKSFFFDHSLQILFDLTNLGEEFDLTMKLSRNNRVISSKKISILIHKDIDRVKKYLTITGQSISIICLFILFIFYIIQKLYEKLPGKIVINLTISLIFSQITFLVSMNLFQNENNLKPNQIFNSSQELFKNLKPILACYLAGALTHYFHLAFFIWSNIMAFDLYQLFEQSTMLIHIYKNQKLFIKYFLYGWLTPLFLIVAMLAKNYNKISYGYQICFISSSIDLLFFFVLPVCILLGVNMVLVILGIKLVVKIDSSNESIKLDSERNRKNKHRVVLFLKLFLITGITWILGIVSSLVNDKYSFLWYIYIVFNSLQGVFLMISFIFNIESKKQKIIKNFIQLNQSSSEIIKN